MKRIFFLLFTVAVMPLWALRPGDKVGKVDFRLKWIDCTPFEIGEVSKEKKAMLPQLRTLVFMFTRSESSNQIIRMLEQLRLQHRHNLLIGVITPDPEHEAKIFRKAHPDVRVRFAVDSERKLTPLFMAGSMLFPMAFVYDADGTVLWNGEAVDLPEAVENILKRKNDVKRQREVSLLLDDMQQRMRSGEFRPLNQCAEKIFKLDPANPSALRMILFVLENSGDPAAAWALLNRRIEAVPGTLRLYYTAVDMMRRYPQLRRNIGPIADKFYRNSTSAGDRITFSENLLLNFAGDVNVLEVIQNQLSVKDFDKNLTVLDKGRFYMAFARLRYLLGDLEGALAYQQKSVDAFAASNARHPARDIALVQLKFYHKLKELRARTF